MELVKVRGRTYCIPGATNIGVYRYRNGFCTLIDTGLDNTTGQKVVDVLQKNNLKVKYIINTHAHPDHFGANNYIKKIFPGAKILASEKEKLFMENNFLEGLLLYGASPMPGFSSKMIKGPDTAVDVTVTDGIVELDGKKFGIVPLAGHSLGQIGVATDDKVIFCGDAFFSEEKMGKYPLPFILNVEEHLKSLRLLMDADYEYYIISHGPCPVKNPKILIQQNIDLVEQNEKVIKKYLEQPLTREDLAQALIKRYGIPENLLQYNITLSSISAFLTYLLERQQIDKDIIDGKMYFYA